MTPDVLLAIDAGTQSTRVLAFDPAGTLLDRARVVHAPPYRSPRPGWAEQDPAMYWEALCAACRALWGNGIVTPDAVAGVAVTAQRGTVITLGARGLPLRPAILWLDQRRTDAAPPVRWWWRLLFTAAGLTGTLAYLQAEAEANWLWAHQREVWSATARYLLLSGYLTYRLTGLFVDSVACQVGYIPFDYRRHDWAQPADWKWQAIPVRREMLPTLFPPGRPLGEVSAEAARDTGIPAGRPVIAAATDKACEALGAGCLDPEVACIGYGTTATINVAFPRYVEPIRLIPPYPSALPGAYNLEVQIYRGFWLVSWFIREFAVADAEAAAREGVAVEAMLDREAEEVPPGSLGLVVLPYWSPGLRYPGPEARGAIVGFRSEHGRAHLYRALLEGLAYGLRHGRERIEGKTRIALREARVCGGGSKSDLATQITADVLNLPAARPQVWETSGLGAAILAAAGVGLYGSVADAARGMTRTATVFEPTSAAVTYDRLYRTVYRPLFDRLSPLYRNLYRVFH